MGAWIEMGDLFITWTYAMVAPLVGAWIEIHRQEVSIGKTSSLPSWERGLKFPLGFLFFPRNCVAPLVGAWIEIAHDARCG